MKPIHVQFTISCSHCGRPLPVNGAAQTVLCEACHGRTDTPVELWQSLVAQELNASCNMESEKVSEARGMMASVGSYLLDYGYYAPRCHSCGKILDLQSLLSMYDLGQQAFPCSACGESHRLRCPPEWFLGVVPWAKCLVDESLPDADPLAPSGESGIQVACETCGAPISLDGKSRTVVCSYCVNSCLIPDAVWNRLQTASAAKPWYVLVDLAGGVAALPDDIDDFVDLAGISDEETALLWEEDGRYRIGRANRDGLLRWIAEGFECSDHARLFYVKRSDELWVLDYHNEAVHRFNASTGELILTITNEDDDQMMVSVLDHENVAVADDNTLLVYRRWGDGPGKIKRFKKKFNWFRPYRLTAEDIALLNTRTGIWEMRRFDAEGRRIALWEGSVDEELNHDMPTWDTMIDRPTQLPENAKLESGPDGTLYMIDPERLFVARFDRAGTCLGVHRPSQKVVRDVEDCGVSPDGSLVVMFNHRRKINNEEWSHVGRLGTDGSFEILVGPHAPKHSYSFGSWVESVSVAETGSIHICDSGFDHLRVLRQDGSLLWRSPGAVRRDVILARELAEAKRFRLIS